MNRLFRSNSSTSQRSSLPSLPEIPQEARILNSENYELQPNDLYPHKVTRALKPVTVQP